MNKKFQQKVYYANVNINLMEEKSDQIWNNDKYPYECIMKKS